MIFFATGLLVLAVIFYRLFYGNNCKLRVLMYHKIDESRQDMLTVTERQLGQHLSLLLQRGYHFISIAQLSQLSQLPSKCILLTFDDAYVNNLECAYPVLKKHGACATIFVPTAFVGTASNWDIEPEALMSIEQLQQLDSTVFELGLHSHKHRSYGTLREKELVEDLQENIQFFRDHQLPFVPAFAFPFGARPKDKTHKQLMQKCMADLGILMAFRIGNRLNIWPLRNRYEVQRIDVRGTDSLEKFARKVTWGRLF